MILDLDLPELTGTEVLVKIHADRKSGSIPILVLTSDDREQAVGRALDAGATDFLSKAADPAELWSRGFAARSRPSERGTLSSGVPQRPLTSGGPARF